MRRFGSGILRRLAWFRWLALLIAVFALSLRPATAEVYVVKKRDTLTSIAKKHGVSVNQLIEANSLSRSGHIQVGQRLQIPRTGRSTPPSSSSTLPPAVARAIEQARVTPGRWDYIVIHHSATTVGSARGMDRYHREQRHMENGLAYHFVIGNGNGMAEGSIAVGHRWTRQLNGGHLASEALNSRSIGICLVGNFDKHRPSRKQLQSLDALTEFLMKRCNIRKSGVKTHQQINTIGTRCPGRLFDDDAFLNGLH